MNRRASNSLPQTNRIIESKSVEVDRFFSFWSIVVITVNNVNSPFFLCWLYLSFTFRWKSILGREEKKSQNDFSPIHSLSQQSVSRNPSEFKRMKKKILFNIDDKWKHTNNGRILTNFLLLGAFVYRFIMKNENFNIEFLPLFLRKLDSKAHRGKK